MREAETRVCKSEDTSVAESDISIKKKRGVTGWIVDGKAQKLYRFCMMLYSQRRSAKVNDNNGAVCPV